MIELTKIRIKEMNFTLSNRKKLEDLRILLKKHFKATSVLFDYKDTKEE